MRQIFELVSFLPRLSYITWSPKFKCNLQCHKWISFLHTWIISAEMSIDYQCSLFWTPKSHKSNQNIFFHSLISCQLIMSKFWTTGHWKNILEVWFKMKIFKINITSASEQKCQKQLCVGRGRNEIRKKKKEGCKEDILKVWFKMKNSKINITFASKQKCQKQLCVGRGRNKIRKKRKGGCKEEIC